MFIEDDYVVVKNNKNLPKEFLNWCFKVKPNLQKNHNYANINSKEANNDFRYNLSDSNYYIENSNLRLANKQEIEHYNKIGKPYDVTTLTQTWKPEVGDYIVITKSDENWGSAMNSFIGKCVQITWCDSYKNSVQFKDSSPFAWNYNQNHFRKATVEEIAKYKRLGYDYFINDLNKSSIEFKEGNYYYGKVYSNEYIFQCKNLKNKQTFNPKEYICISTNDFF